MIWSKLTDEQRIDIQRVYAANPSADTITFLSQKYELNPSSLERKFRHIKNTTGLTAPALDGYTFTNHYITKETRFILVGDIHIPHHDRIASNVFFRAVEVIQPELIVFMGDILDMYSLSTFNKHAGRATSENVKHEIGLWQDWYEELGEVLPKDITQYALMGNHEERYERWLTESPAVHDLEVLKLSNLMGFPDMGINGFHDEIRINPRDNKDYPDAMMYLRHGTSSLKNASSSSRKEAESLGYTNIAVGHVHRLSVSYRRTDRGQASMTEVGCLCMLTPTYMIFPDWTQGFVHGVMDKDNITSINPVKIQDGRTSINGITVHGF